MEGVIFNTSPIKKFPQLLGIQEFRIQKHLFDNEKTCSLIITPRYFILWDQNQFHTTYIEASTVDIEH